MNKGLLPKQTSNKRHARDSELPLLNKIREQPIRARRYNGSREKDKRKANSIVPVSWSDIVNVRKECPLCSQSRHKRRVTPQSRQRFTYVKLRTQTRKSANRAVGWNDDHHHCSTQTMSAIYHFTFSCGHTQSQSAILVSRKSIRRFSTPCVRCEPHTPLGQALIRQIISSGGIPHLTRNGDIIVDAAPAGGVKALKLVPKLKVGRDRDGGENWGNARRRSQRCLVH